MVWSEGYIMPAAGCFPLFRSADPLILAPCDSMRPALVCKANRGLAQEPLGAAGAAAEEEEPALPAAAAAADGRGRRREGVTVVAARRSSMLLLPFPALTEAPAWSEPPPAPLAAAC